MNWSNSPGTVVAAFEEVLIGPQSMMVKHMFLAWKPVSSKLLSVVLLKQKAIHTLNKIVKNKRAGTIDERDGKDLVKY